MATASFLSMLSAVTVAVFFSFLLISQPFPRSHTSSFNSTRYVSVAVEPGFIVPIVHFKDFVFVASFTVVFTLFFNSVVVVPSFSVALILE